MALYFVCYGKPRASVIFQTFSVTRHTRARCIRPRDYGHIDTREPLQSINLIASNGGGNHRGNIFFSLRPSGQDGLVEWLSGIPIGKKRNRQREWPLKGRECDGMNRRKKFFPLTRAHEETYLDNPNETTSFGFMFTLKRGERIAAATTIRTIRMGTAHKQKQIQQQQHNSGVITVNKSSVPSKTTRRGGHFC